MSIVKVQYKNNKFVVGRTEVIPPQAVINLLKGKGDKSFSFVKKENILYGENH